MSSWPRSAKRWRRCNRRPAPEIDHEFESGRLLDRQITRLGAAYNLVDIRRATPPQVVTADAIGRNPTYFGELSQGGDHGQPVGQCEGADSGSKRDREFESGLDDVKTGG
jgi:hypothetical protein